jgi:hypothetical protein
MSKEYVVDGAQLKCTLGVAPSNLCVLSQHRVQLRCKNRANVGDAIPFTNILPFGACKITSPPKPCSPVCVEWIGGKSDFLVEGLPALLDSSKLICAAGGGIITIKDSGQ